MTRGKKLALGIATFWPVLYILLFMVFMVTVMFTAMDDPAGEGPMPAAMAVIFPLHFLTVFLTLGLWVFYIVHAVKNRYLADNERVVWILAIVFAGYFVMPVYWWIKIWREGQ